MSTGLTSVAKLSEIGAAYPFHGLEVLFALVILAFFVVFMIWQFAMEAKHHAAIISHYGKSANGKPHDEAEMLGSFEPAEIPATAS
jgi:hypothetical protein